MKAAADCPGNNVGRFPKSALKWMQTVSSSWESLINKDPQLQKFEKRLDSLAKQLNLTDETLQLFRDWHYLFYPHESVAGLPIDNDLFFLLIQTDIYMVAKLKKLLRINNLPSCLIHQEKSLQQAIQTWSQQQNR